MAKQPCTLLAVNITREQHDHIRALATARGFQYVSDYVLHLLEHDAKEYGVVMPSKERRRPGRPRKNEQEGEG
jgi:hypothetical protein